MPKIKCEHGHPVHVSTPDFLSGLTVNQLRYAGERIDAMLEKIDDQPRRTVWRVSSGGSVCANFREEDYEKAADHLLSIYKEKFMEEAARFIESPGNIYHFKEELPEIEPERCSQHEYDTEWFPPVKATQE